LLVNVAVGGTLADDPGSSVTFPQTMLIDYIRLLTRSEDAQV
jgi:beta-glucanase (GH16 family)